MTLEEVSININVYAEDAMAALDAVSEKMRALGSVEIKPKVDQQPILDMGSALEKTVKGAGSAMNSTIGDVIDKLEEGKQSAWGFGDLLGQLAGSAKSIFGKGLVGGRFRCWSCQLIGPPLAEAG